MDEESERTTLLYRGDIVFQAVTLFSENNEYLERCLYAVEDG